MHSIHQTEKAGAMLLSKRRRQEQVDAKSSKNWTMEEKVFGKKIPENNNNAHDDDNNYIDCAVRR
jgi:hypothetical protein